MNPLEKAWALLKGTEKQADSYNEWDERNTRDEHAERLNQSRERGERSQGPPIEDWRRELGEGGEPHMFYNYTTRPMVTQIDPAIVRLIMEKLGRTNIDPYDQETREEARQHFRPVTSEKPPHLEGLKGLGEEQRGKEWYGNRLPHLGLWSNLDHQNKDTHYEDSRQPRTDERGDLHDRKIRNYRSEMATLFG